MEVQPGQPIIAKTRCVVNSYFVVSFASFYLWFSAISFVLLIVPWPLNG